MKKNKGGRPKADPVLFTAAEERVVLRLAQGISNKVIAGTLGLTEKTVKSHLTSIYRKYGVTKDREFLVKYLSR